MVVLDTPSVPLSDVTSILTPTNDGKICALPYKVANFTWDMYFCNRGYCPTEINSNSTCATGQFGNVPLTNNTIKSFQIKTKSGGINGTNEQCLVYYYYLSNVTNNIMTVIKEEMNGKNETIDSVTSTPINGWIRRQVSFFALESNYKIFFDIQRRSGTLPSSAGIDELSIYQDNCSEDILTTELTSMTTIEDTTFTTSIQLETTTTTQSTNIIILTSSASAMTTDNMSETKFSMESTSNTLPTTVISLPITTAFYTTIGTLSIVDSTQEEIHSSTTSQTILSTHYENSTITVITITSSSPIETTLITITNTLTNNVNPSKETYIIILSTVIPTVVILLIIGIVWWKKSSSKSIFTRSSRVFPNLNKRENSNGDHELEQV
ncbi:unnamed protein product [Adineta steineri]|uniref:MAM domain-containing protein n=1 Tax=Adineta steineri TaxID=433720 RepID=A0A819HZW0_9BILA|nr:unnamed protein product [Adineta steineri]